MKPKRNCSRLRLHCISVRRRNSQNTFKQPEIAISSSEDAQKDLPERFQVKQCQFMIRDSVFGALRTLAGNQAKVVADSTVLQYYMGSQTFKDENVKFISQELPVSCGSNLVCAVKKGNKELLDKINVGLANAKKSGEYETILKKWKQAVPSDVSIASAPAVK
ncbi:transporter substrate-binding domain-containing protein [Kingella negevensis]|nr:transporter substrate-binding domain-containing protein [Kingella negevensis]MDK4683867.1 transporter substrate-binding domain-containing protein [Kingella negevensis]WII92395.1 transporter substrate-binding domain-containing protein [Kingella negevensis]